MERKVDRIKTPSTRGTGRPAGLGGPVPAGIPPILRRFWDFTRKMAKMFSKSLLNGDEKEEALIKAVQRDVEKWS